MKFIYNIIEYINTKMINSSKKIISLSSVNNYIDNKIKQSNNTNKYDENEINELEVLHDEIELEKLENELYIKSHNSKNYPKNYGNLWTEDERKIILNYLKKNNYLNNSNLFDELIIEKIANKTERSMQGVKEEIKKMIFNDYISNFYSLSELSNKYNISEHNIKILIKIYLEKYGKKILYPIEIENKILKYQVENIKLRKELKELKELVSKCN
jgi:hypothetical protein